MDIQEILQESRFPEEAIIELSRKITPLELRKNKYFIRYGEKVDKIGILFGGTLVSRFSSEEGKEVASKFYFLGGDNIVVDYFCFKNQIDSTEEIQAIEDSKLLTLKYEDYHSLIKKYPEFGKSVAEYAELSYLKALNRIRDFQLLNAEGRVKKFYKTHGSVANKIAIKDKASYLGMSRNVFTKKFNGI